MIIGIIEQDFMKNFWFFEKFCNFLRKSWEKLTILEKILRKIDIFREKIEIFWEKIEKFREKIENSWEKIEIFWEKLENFNKILWSIIIKFLTRNPTKPDILLKIQPEPDPNPTIFKSPTRTRPDIYFWENFAYFMQFFGLGSLKQFCKL